MQGLEPWASCSQSRRATNCATPRYEVRRSGRAYSPKSSAIPTSLHPDIQFLPLYHGREENQRFFCLWSFLWSKLLLCRFRQPGKTRYCLYRKALRRFALPRPGYNHGTPKPGAIPTSLYPDKDMPPASGRHIYYTSFFPRLQGKNLSWCLLYSGAFPPRRITAPAPHSGRPPDRSFPRPRPGPPGPYGRRPPAYDRWAFADPDRG